MESYWFKSTIFEVDPDEDLETNPRCYGRQLATWLKNKFIELGYEAEVVPEDWGWCVICSRSPYYLWIGCRNLVDYDTARPSDPPPTKEQLLWNCGAVAEVSIFKKLFKRIDSRSGLEKLNNQLSDILKAENCIELVDAP